MSGAADRVGRTWSAPLGYWYLHEGYTRQRFTYFTNVSGAILGVSSRF